jgi:hypothetical protein
MKGRETIAQNLSKAGGTDFPFGTDFVADFVGLGPFSGSWDIHFIELEPPMHVCYQEW